MKDKTSNPVISRLDSINEFERAEVSQDRLHGPKNFIALYASEHVAGTEFVIGPLFVAHGVTAYDFFVGLLFGNILAVLSWALICAPVAVKSRLTMFWQIRRTCGPWMTVIYSVSAGIVFCIVAGAMVTVSTTAASLPLGITNPSTASFVPSIPWVSLAFAISAAICLFAIYGFTRLSAFAKVCAPWMPCVFIGSALATLPMLDCNSIETFWHTAQTRIFTGEPLLGFSKYTFWHVVGFAWLCNASQHLGLGDITILRYARKWQYGLASAFGMFIGHYVAWTASAILCAVALERGISTDPGSIAWLGAGWTGIVCVLLAGITTANPCLYRAGLAFQVVTPAWSRWRVTLAASAVMFVAACVPNLITSLDRLLAYSGLFFLAPGAVIFTDMFLLPRFGLLSNFAELCSLSVSWPAIGAWILAFSGPALLHEKDLVGWLGWINQALPSVIASSQFDLFMLTLPAWLTAMICYTVFSTVQQRNLRLPPC